MSEKKSKILFVSHKANNSGAPLVLLSILKAFKQKTTVPFEVLCMEDGALVNEFSKLCKTYIWKVSGKEKKSFLDGFTKSLIRIRQILRGVYIISRLKGTRLIVYNTIANGHIQKKLAVTSAKHIYYVHELEAAIQMLTNTEERKFLFEKTSAFLAVSHAVRSNLIASHGVPEENIITVATPMQANHRTDFDHKDYRDKFKSLNGITNEIIIGVLGAAEWRKGFDFFIPLVTIFFKRFPNADVQFIWKGLKDDYMAFVNTYDFEKSGLQNKIKLLPHDQFALETLACYDIHLLLSREDPYPLVMLEAASYSIPTICFQNAGGAPEFVGDDCGFTVPYGDLLAMADKLYELSTNTELRVRMGIASRQKLVQKHDEEKCMKALTTIFLQSYN